MIRVGMLQRNRIFQYVFSVWQVRKCGLDSVDGAEKYLRVSLEPIFWEFLNIFHLIHVTVYFSYENWKPCDWIINRYFELAMKFISDNLTVRILLYPFEMNMKYSKDHLQTRPAYKARVLSHHVDIFFFDAPSTTSYGSQFVNLPPYCETLWGKLYKIET